MISSILAMRRDEGRLRGTLDALARRSAMPHGKQPTAQPAASLATVEALIEQADEPPRERGQSGAGAGRRRRAQE